MSTQQRLLDNIKHLKRIKTKNKTPELLRRKAKTLVLKRGKPPWVTRRAVLEISEISLKDLLKTVQMGSVANAKLRS